MCNKRDPQNMHKNPGLDSLSNWMRLQTVLATFLLVALHDILQHWSQLRATGVDVSTVGSLVRVLTPLLVPAIVTGLMGAAIAAVTVWVGPPLAFAGIEFARKQVVQFARELVEARRERPRDGDKTMRGLAASRSVEFGRDCFLFRRG